MSSDLSRAWDTAQTIAGRHPDLNVHSDRRLRELFYGSWEGLTWEQIVARYPTMREVSLSSPADYAIEGGESFVHMRDRVAEVLSELRASQLRTVLIVTHAGPLHAILRTLLPADHDALRVRFAPASITRLNVENGRGRLVVLNETRHLSTLPTSY